MKELIYIAIPYTFDSEKSVKIADKVSAELMKQGYSVISPISQSHRIANHLDPDLRFSQEFWQAIDDPLVIACNRMCLIRIHIEEKSAEQLIEESKGCQHEIEVCNKYNKEIFYFDYYGE